MDFKTTNYATKNGTNNYEIGPIGEGFVLETSAKDDTFSRASVRLLKNGDQVASNIRVESYQEAIDWAETMSKDPAVLLYLRLSAALDSFPRLESGAVHKLVDKALKVFSPMLRGLQPCLMRKLQDVCLGLLLDDRRSQHTQEQFKSKLGLSKGR